jgi:hypothetical protein
MKDPGAFFSVESTSAGDVLTRMRGLAVSGALARAVERAAPDPGLRPVRWTLELCRVATMDPCHADVRILRTGRRIGLVEADLMQGDHKVATARALFLKPDPEVGTADVWTSPHRWQPPPPDLSPGTDEPRLHYSDDEGWVATPASEHSDRRKVMWVMGIRIAENEVPTPFQFAASAADVASVVGNWGAAGMQFINADVTLALARLPEGLEIGLAATDRVEQEGISTSTVTVFDRSGTLGTAVICAVANLRATVDPRLR